MCAVLFQIRLNIPLVYRSRTLLQAPECHFRIADLLPKNINKLRCLCP